MGEYDCLRRVVYGDGEGATFIPVCSKCGRYVRADKSVRMNDLGETKGGTNATCKKCGRVLMPFDGYFNYDEV